MRTAAAALALALVSAPSLAQVPPEVQMPGTQPQQVAELPTVGNCTMCHANYDAAVEPWHNWQGGMMSHAARDPLFWATLAVAEQDFPGSGDLCLRCHSPSGWIGGRSTPTNGQALQAATDADGVHCATCHRLTNPDTSEHLGVQVPPFLAHDGSQPPVGYYGSAMYVLWGGSELLGPYSVSHPMFGAKKSKFHRDPRLCGTCHDVSNPVVGDLAPSNGAFQPLPPGSFSGVPGSPITTKAAFQNFPYQYGVVERTFSEHQASAFASMPVSQFPNLPAELQRGALLHAYQAATAANPQGNYEDGTVRTFSCQTCHMPPVTGKGASMGPFVPTRKDLPLHDQTGGNYWAPEAIRYLDQQGKLIFGGGLTPAQLNALTAGAQRARQTLERSAALDLVGDELRVVNLTGHKLPTGYPEGRRMWLRITWRDAAGNVVREDGGYGPIPVTIQGQADTVETLLDPHGPHTIVFEARPGIRQDWAAKLVQMGTSPSVPLTFDRTTGQVTMTLGQLASAPPGTSVKTFHFVLNDTVTFDSRIPPYGFSYDEALARNALPVPETSYGAPGPGGVYEHFARVPLLPPVGAASADIELLYQPTSWEYIQFLLLANQGQDPFLAQAGAHLFEAWKATGMAAPHTIAQTTWTIPTGHPWRDLESSLAGSAGYPRLVGHGPLTAGSPVSLELDRCPPQAPVLLVIGLQQANAPFLGGTLVPSLDVVIPGVATDTAGRLTLAGVWPAGVPSGTQLVFQAVVQDAGVSAGAALSNALLATTP